MTTTAIGPTEKEYHGEPNRRCGGEVVGMMHIAEKIAHNSPRSRRGDACGMGKRVSYGMPHSPPDELPLSHVIPDARTRDDVIGR